MANKASLFRVNHAGFLEWEKKNPERAKAVRDVSRWVGGSRMLEITNDPEDTLEKLEVAMANYDNLAASMGYGNSDYDSRLMLPPHIYRELVNDLRETAKLYGHTAQLRAQISATLSKYLLPATESNDS